MKRYLIFAALSPLLGGFWLLLTTTVMSGYWSHPPSLSEAEKLLAVFASTLQYSYLFGLLPALMLGAVDDILFHVKRMAPVVRMLIVGADRLCCRRIALRLARTRQRCAPVHPLRPGRLYSGDGRIMAGASGDRQAGDGVSNS